MNVKSGFSEKPMNRHTRFLRDTKEYADQTMKLFHKFQKDHVDTASVEKERQNLKTYVKSRKWNVFQAAEAKAKETAEAIRSFSWRYRKGAQPESERNSFQSSGFQRISLCADGYHPFQGSYLRSGACGRAGDHHSVHAAYRRRKDPYVQGSQHFHRDQSSGKTVDEAVAELDKYLDDAYIAHMKSVRIVHGKGTGALRKGVHNYLKRQKHVASFRLGEFEKAMPA